MINYPNLFINPETIYKVENLQRLDKQIQLDAVKAVRQAQRRADQDVQTNLPNQTEPEPTQDQEPSITDKQRRFILYLMHKFQVNTRYFSAEHEKLGLPTNGKVWTFLGTRSKSEARDIIRGLQA